MFIIVLHKVGRDYIPGWFLILYGDPLESFPLIIVTVIIIIDIRDALIPFSAQ